MVQRENRLSIGKRRKFVIEVLSKEFVSRGKERGFGLRKQSGEDTKRLAEEGEGGVSGQ